MILNSGRLNRRIKIFGKKTVTSPRGFTTTKDTIVATTWAAIVPFKVQDNQSENITTTTDTTKFIIRYRSNIDTNNTIYYKDKEYRILSITNPYTDNESLEIIAECMSRGSNTNNKTVGHNVG